MTGLRFIAAALVVLYHCSRYFLPEMSAITGLGYVGVTFFFVLSGFILTWTHDEESSRRVFYWKRFARIYPLFLLTTAAAAVLILFTRGSLPIPQLGPVLTLTQAWIPSGDWKYAYNGVSWSLSDEAFFYLISPFVALLLLRRSRKFAVHATWIAVAAMAVVAAVVIAVLPEITWDSLTYTNPAFRVGEFIVGIALGVVMRKGSIPRIAPWVAGVTFLAGLVIAYLIAGSMFAAPWDMPFVVSDLLVLPGVAAVIIAFAQSDLAGRSNLFATRALVRLGEWSFALYLVHEIVIKITVLVVRDESLLIRSFGVVAVVAVSITISAALYHWFERPVERRLRPLVGHPKPRVEAT